jgi:hypothetical protein
MSLLLEAGVHGLELTDSTILIFAVSAEVFGVASSLGKTCFDIFHFSLHELLFLVRCFSVPHNFLELAGGDLSRRCYIIRQISRWA